ncbi:MAG TPA: hypothetical protein VL738_03005 [Dactylosporangium sp.]|nr:hypothetical protein [Dactylosporangium sp.]
MQRLRRIVLVSVAVLAAVVATGLGIAYSLGLFAEAGRFKAAPGCGVLDPAMIAPAFANPSANPSAAPTANPTANPSAAPSANPSVNPSAAASANPAPSANQSAAVKVETDGDNCTATDGKVQVNVGYTVVTKQGTVGGPELASRFLTAVAGTDTEKLDGVGEQAIRQRTQAIGAPQVISMRVSNLIVVLSVVNLDGGDLPAGAEDGLVKVATALGTRLGA